MDLRELPAQNGAHRHPWETARAKALVHILRSIDLPRGLTVLDVGCGDGYCGQTLREALSFARLTGIDIELDDTACAQPNSALGGLRYLNDPAAVEGHFDLLLLLDVLEHVEDDAGFLSKQVDAHLARDGLALITVPAFQQLFCRHDTFLRHVRRYSLSQLRTLTEEAGLELVRGGYLFGSLLLPRAFTVLRERLWPNGFAEQEGLGGWQGGRLATRAFETLFELDNRWMLALGKHLALPGLSGWALCRKR